MSRTAFYHSVQVGDSDSAPAAPQMRVIGPASVIDGPMGFFENWSRLFVGLAWVGVCSLFFVFVLFLCLPSRATRIKVGNVYGSWVGRGCALISGSRYIIKGEEYADHRRQTVYVCNHTSLLDIFLGVWMSQWGTCGVAKKEIVYYPFLGQFFWLAGHLTIDRGNNTRAVAALKKLVAFVRKQRLSIYIWPEGTRSRDGRLLPFKRGAFHMALETKFPIVPIVVRGSHRAWANRTLSLYRTTVEIEFLAPIDTAHWTKEHLDEHIAEVHNVYVRHLPEDQKPLTPAVTTTTTTTLASAA